MVISAFTVSIPSLINPDARRSNPVKYGPNSLTVIPFAWRNSPIFSLLLFA